jgi:hypothetical protein
LGALLRSSRTTDSPRGRPILLRFLFGLGPHSAACALLSQSQTTKAQVSLFLLDRAGGKRLCGLASVGRDPLLLGSVELGLLMPFVHLGLSKEFAQNGVRPAARPKTTGGRAPWEHPVENSRRGGRALTNTDSKKTGRVARGSVPGSFGGARRTLCAKGIARPGMQQTDGPTLFVEGEVESAGGGS